jgi:hypothetical protein
VTEISEKRCPKCREVKPLSEFWKNRSMRDGLQNYCKLCHTEKSTAHYHGPKAEFYRRIQVKSYLKRVHNLNIETYEEMGQRGCWICGHVPGPSDRRLAVDHDHRCCAEGGSCGKCIRGLLCRACNQGLGQFGDDPERLEAAAAYLRASDS